MPKLYELKQMQGLPLEAKIIKTQQRIREWYDHWDGMVYVSYSGGKDSSVLRHIVKEMYPDVPAVFIDTGLEYPEVRKCALKYADVVLRPKMRFDDVIKKYGYPVVSKNVSNYVYTVRSNPHGKSARRFDPNGGYNVKCKTRYSLEKYKYLLDAPYKIGDGCCRVMKKNPAKNFEKSSCRKPIIGMLANESDMRMTKWLKEGCNAFDNHRPESNPMSFWTERDVLQYINRYNVEIPTVYGDIVETDLLGTLKCTGVQRTGCMFCMFGAHLEKEPNRFQRMKITHPKQWEYCMKPVEDGGLGLKKVLDYIGVKSE